jgi:hypothetical protein
LCGVCLGSALKRLENASTLGDVGSGREDGRKRPVVSHGRASLSYTVGDVIGHLDSDWVVAEVLWLESVEVGKDLNVVSVEFDETVLIVFLVVFVDETSREHVLHVGTEETVDVLKVSSLGNVAPEFGEHHGNVEGSKVLSECSVSALLKRRLSTPSVDVDSPKVHLFFLGSTIKVALHVYGQSFDVGGGVTDGSCESSSFDVSLQVSNGCFDVSGGSDGVFGVGDFVSSDEGEKVGVRAETVDFASKSGEEWSVPLRIDSIDAGLIVSDVEHHVDTGVVQEGHSCIVIVVGVRLVHSNDVHSQFFEVWDVSIQSLDVCKRISRRLVVHSFGVPLISGHRVEEFGASNDDGVQRFGDDEDRKENSDGGKDFGHN